MADKKAKKAKIEETKEQVLINRISSFASNNKKWIIIALAVIVFALVAVVIITSSVNKNREERLIRVAGYEDSLLEMIDSTDESVVNAYLSNVEKEIDGSSYPSVKAAYILGQYYATKENWAKSYDYFMKAYNLNSEIYLASLSLFNAAVVSEEKGDVDNALALYAQLGAIDDAPFAPEALFNAARLYMDKGNTDLAKATFQQLASKFVNSEYAFIAKNILVTL